MRRQRLRPTGFASFLAIAVLLSPGLAPDASAGSVLFCDDLGSIPEIPRVDFVAEVQPIFDRACGFCHGFSGGLSLAPGESYEALYCQPNQGSGAPPATLRVVPFAPEASWLLLRVSCDAEGDPFFRMPQGSALATSDQALLRDWIAQGARLTAEDVFATGFEPNESCVP